MKNNKKKPINYIYNSKLLNKFSSDTEGLGVLNRKTYAEEVGEVQLTNYNIKKSLDFVKENTMRQIVLGNKQVPQKWRVKVDYKQTLVQMLCRNKSVMGHLGVKNNEDFPEKKLIPKRLSPIVRSVSPSKQDKPNTSRKLANLAELNEVKDLLNIRRSDHEIPKKKITPEEILRLKKKNLKFSKEKLIEKRDIRDLIYNISDKGHFGPYYSLCNGCNKRNVNFYNYIQPERGIDILNLLKTSYNNKSKLNTDS